MRANIHVVTGSLLLMLSATCLAQPGGVGPIEVNAESISVSGNGHHRTFPCNGRKLVVEGSDHVVKTTGVCSQVQVYGAKNEVDVAVAPSGTLEVAGTGHLVRWKSTGEPKQDISGIDNQLTRVK